MGFLSNTLEDDQNIANAGSAPGEGITELPSPTTFQNFGGAVGRSVVGGFGAVGQFAQDSENAIGQFAQAHPLTYALPGFAAAAAPYALSTDEEKQRAQKYLDATIKFGKVDPTVTGSASLFAGQTAKGLTEAGIGSVAGPWGAAALLGGASADEQYHDLRVQGVDKSTALADAGIVGATNAAFALFPIKFGGSLAAGTAKAVGAGVGLGAASRLSQSVVLAANGYTDMADAVRPFDKDSLLSDAVMTAFFNAAGHFGSKLTPKPSNVDAAMAASAETHYNQSGFGIPTDPATANLHTDTLAAHIDAMTRDEMPAPIDPEAAQKLADGVILDPQPLALAQAIHESLNAEPDVAAVRAAPELKEPIYVPGEPKPFYEMTGDELGAQRESAIGLGRQIEDRVLGDKADAWRRAQRARESFDDAKADKAASTVDDLEKGLSQHEVDALYGVGFPRGVFDEAQDFADAHSDAQVATPEEAATVIGRYMTKLGNTEGSDPAQWTREQQVAYSAIRHVRDRIAEEGWDSKAIQKQAIRNVARRFSDPLDAETMLGRFLKETPKAVHTPPDAKPKVLPAQHETRRASERLQRFDELDARKQAGGTLSADEMAELLDLHDLRRTTGKIDMSDELLPGTGNRLALDRAMAGENPPTHFAFIDVDNFKKINDENGYDAGDEAIANTAAELVRSARGAARVHHLSGDEFVIAGHDEQALRDIHAQAEKYLGEKHGIKISAGFGGNLRDAEAGLKTEKAARLAGGKRTARDASDSVPGGAIPVDRQAGASGDRNSGNGQAESGGKGVSDAAGLRAGERSPESSYSGNPVTDEILNKLVEHHGQKLVTMEDGRQVPIAQIAGELRQQYQEAEHASGLIDVAVACFLRTGGAA